MACAMIRAARFAVLGVVTILLCCVLQAASPPYEQTPLFSRVHGQKSNLLREQWRAKIQTCLEQKDLITVFYFPKKEECYSVTYDVSSSTVLEWFVFEEKWQRAIVPVSYTLKQELLQGYVLKPGCFEPSITSADFSAQDAILDRYWLKKFFSRSLDYSLTEMLPKLVEQGKAHFDRDNEALTEDMLKAALPKWKLKRFEWSVVDEDRAVEIVQESKKKPTVLLIIGGCGGILWGELAFCVLYPRQNSRSLFYYKFTNDLTVRSVFSQYPFAKEKRRSCLNYTEKTQQIM